MQIGQQIKEARERRGMSQRALAQKIEVSNEAVRQWEAGIVTPSPKHVAAVAVALGMKIQMVEQADESGREGAA